MNTPCELTVLARSSLLLLLLLACPSAASAAEPATASHSFHPLPERPRPIRIAIYEGSGSQDSGIRDVERGVKLLPGARLERLPPAAFASAHLAEFDVVVFSAGGASTQAKDIGEAGRKNVRRFVRRGGAYLGICAGAYLACAEFDWGLKLIAAETISDKWQRGTGKVQMQLTPEGRRAFGSADAPLAVAYENGPVIAPLEVEGIPPYRSLATFTTELAENDTPPGIMTGSPAIAEGRLGKGRVMIFSPHPERTPGLEQVIPLAITRLTAEERGQSTGTRGQ
jgi:glutamine amidotransferase-like uncharacterized protein